MTAEEAQLQWETVETGNDEPGYFQRLRLEHGYLYCRYNGPHLAMAFVPDAPPAKRVCPPHSDVEFMLNDRRHVRCMLCGRVQEVL